MSKLSAFLQPVKTHIEKEVLISDRFVDSDGNPVPFKIKALTQEENDQIVRAATKVETKNGQRTEHLDAVDYARRVIVAATIEPNFAAKEMCEAYGVVSPYLVPGKMLLSGEYNRLMRAITDLAELEESGTNEEIKN